MQNKNNNEKGYTLIETMIAVSLFIVIVIAGMNALLNANLLHNKSQNMRSIMDSLSFTMDDISRNLRTGYNYQCISGGVAGGTISSPITPTNGQNCGGIAFEPSAGGPPWAYEIVPPPDGSNPYIIRTEDGGQTWVTLTPTEAAISANSGFSIVGAEPPTATPADYQQPFITIKFTGTIPYENITTSFSLQTSVSQRQIDI